MDKSGAIPDYHHDFGFRNPNLLRLERLPPNERWRALKRLDGYRRHFYRWRTFQNLEWIRDIVIDGKLYLATPDSLNDPFEMRAHAVFEGTASEKRKELHRKAKEKLNQTWKQRQEHVNRLMTNQAELEEAARFAYNLGRANTGICSFGDDPTNVEMWSHYADKHKGLCIQFDVARAPRRLLVATRVEYSDEFPVFNFAKPTKPQLITTMLRKAKRWAYENERRIVLPEGAHTNYRFPAEACSAVIVGCNAELQNVEWIRSLNEERQRSGLPLLKLYKTVLSKTSYRIWPVPLGTV